MLHYTNANYNNNAVLYGMYSTKIQVMLKLLSFTAVHGYNYNTGGGQMYIIYIATSTICCLQLAHIVSSVTYNL